MTAPSAHERFERLIQAIAAGSKLRRTWSLAGGISARMTALEIERPDGQAASMIVRQPGEGSLKQNPHAAQDEFKLLQLTRSLGLATPEPYYLDQSGTIFPTPYLVIEYVEGQPEFAPARPADFIRQLATQLAKIHSADCSNLDVSFLPRYPGECAESSARPPAPVDILFDVARIRAAFAAGPPAQRNAPSLLHGDFWPGNILWRDGQLVAMVDWEDAALGDPLADLAISRLDVLCIFGVDALDAFTDHYTSKVAIDYADLPYWDLCAALRLVRMADANFADWATFFPPFGRPDIAEQTLTAHYQYFVAQAFEKLAVR